MPGIGVVIREIDVNISEIWGENPFCSVKTSKTLGSVNHEESLLFCFTLQ